jgi:GDP-L-fucose synthase
MDPLSKIYVAGHTGLVGSALLRNLAGKGYRNIITAAHEKLDLTRQDATEAFFAKNKPEYVFLCAAKVGGIHANNTYPANFISLNLMMQSNIIQQSCLHGIKRLLFLGSSCIYPKSAPQPIREEYLMTGPLEPTNSAYAVAKIAGIEMCWAFNRQYGTQYIPVMPCNLYGLNDNFDLETSHVLPAMIRKFHLARLAQTGDSLAIARDEKLRGKIPDAYKVSLGLAAIGNSSQKAIPTVALWGTGSPLREFLYVDDLADACIYLMNLPDIFLEFPKPLFNIGAGRDQTIRELAGIISDVVNFRGNVQFDPNMPDGMPRKLLDISKIRALGWHPETDLEEGIRRVYQSYLAV